MAVGSRSRSPGLTAAWAPRSRALVNQRRRNTPPHRETGAGLALVRVRWPQPTHADLPYEGRPLNSKTRMGGRTCGALTKALLARFAFCFSSPRAGSAV